MEIYRLSSLGYKLSHTIRHEDSPSWRVVHYLSRMHAATKEKIIAEVPGTTPAVLLRLRLKKIIVEESGVEV